MEFSSMGLIGGIVHLCIAPAEMCKARVLVDGRVIFPVLFQDPILDDRGTAAEA